MRDSGEFRRSLPLNALQLGDLVFFKIDLGHLGMYIGGGMVNHAPQTGDDSAGNPLATTFMDYLLPSAPDIPNIEVGHIETLSDSIGGYKGMGEGGAIGRHQRLRTPSTMRSRTWAYTRRTSSSGPGRSSTS